MIRLLYIIHREPIISFIGLNDDPTAECHNFFMARTVFFCFLPGPVTSELTNDIS
jgi:hypothetical protein